MIIKHSHYREFEFDRLAYFGKETAAKSQERAEKNEEEKQSQEEIEAKVKWDSSKDRAELWADLEEGHGYDAISSELKLYVDKIGVQFEDGYKTDIVQHAVASYMERFKVIHLDFKRETRNLEKDFLEARESITEAATERRTVLKDAIERNKNYDKEQADFAEMPKANKEVMYDHFGEGMNSLARRYFDAKVNFGLDLPESWHGNIPLFSALIHGKDSFVGKGDEGYYAKASNLHAGMVRWVKSELEYLGERKGSSAEDYQRLQRAVVGRYKMFASLDKNSAIISGRDIEKLDQVRFKSPDSMVLRMNDANRSPGTLRRMELTYLMQPDVWEEASEGYSDMVIAQTINYGKEKEFVDMINRELKRRGKPPVEAGTRAPRYAKRGKGRESTRFDAAALEFKKMMKERSERGPRATLAFAERFSQSAMGEIVSFRNDVEDDLKIQTHKQLSYMMMGELTPDWESDKALVSFMRAGRDQRNEILANDASRQALFRGIKLATTLYKERFEKLYKPREKGRKRSYNIEKPTADDRLAQLRALVILGEQAQVVVENYSKLAEHKGNGFMDEIDEAKVPEDIKSVKLGRRFRRPGRKTVRTRSALELGRFTTGGLALKGAKIIGALAVVSNLAQSFSEAEGDDTLDKLFNTVEIAAGNHGLLAGAAVATGAHLAEMNTGVLRYHKMSEKERWGLGINLRLQFLDNRLGAKTVKKFKTNDAEYQALDHSNMSMSTIKDLQEAATERAKENRGKPVITPEDIRAVLPEGSPIYANLGSDYKSNRMRYLFYKNFFAGKIKPNVNEFKQLVTGNSYIKTEKQTA